MTLHTVRPGETLTSIAESYGTTVRNLISLNGMPNPERLAVGQCIIVAYPKRLHIVEQGESLFSIALRYGVTVNSLYRNNPALRSFSEISPGEELVISYEERPIASFKTGGYAYEFIDEALLREALPFLDSLTPFTYGFTASGELLPLNDGRLLEAASDYGIETFLHLSTLTEYGNFDSALGSTILNDGAARAVLIDNLVREINEKGYDGLDVDFEFLPARDVEEYVGFISEARARLAPLGKKVLVALAPKTSDSQPGLLYEGHDYGALGAAADFVLVMSYEWGYIFSEPKAVSPIPSMRRVYDYALTRIPRNKIYMGVSNYGYDWPLPYIKGTTRATSVSTDNALSLASRYRAEIYYDDVSKSPYFYYTNEDGKVHEVWFEDARSIGEKLRLCAQLGLYGVLDWNLDRRNRQNLTMMNLLVLGNR